MDHLAEKGLLRRLRRIDQHSVTTVRIGNKELVSFASNDYLGLANHPRIRKAAQAALSWGTGATGSRLTTGNFALHEQLEEKIAQFKHTESAALFSSGYAANVAVIDALVGPGDLILSDRLNHASLIDGCRISGAAVRVYRHNDWQHAEDLLDDRSEFRRLLIVTDGVFSMDGDIAPLQQLVRLCDHYNGWLMVDDAHGTGVYGLNGSGIVNEVGLSTKVAIQMGTLSKALGVGGAFVAGSAILIEFLRNKARSFVYSTALPPSDVAAAIAAIEIVESEPKLRRQLAENGSLLRDGLKKVALDILPGDSPIVPIIVGTAELAVEFSSMLEEAGYWIPAIRPPSVPDGESRLRITISAAHTTAQIEGLVQAVKTISTALGIS